MASTTLLSSISRTGTVPIVKTISAPDCKGYLSVTISNWTKQMFYELVCLHIDVYTTVSGEDVKYKQISLCCSFNMKKDSYSFILKDLPMNCKFYITPVFNNDALAARNDLIDNGLIEGTKWTTPTDTFDVTVVFYDTI